MAVIAMICLDYELGVSIFDVHDYEKLNIINMGATAFAYIDKVYLEKEDKKWNCRSKRVIGNYFKKTH